MPLRHRTAAVIATTIAVAGLPAAASAHERVSPSSVRSHAAAAGGALERLDRAVRADRAAVARRELRSARRHTQLAAREARGLRRHARTGPATVGAARSLALAGTQYGELLTAVTALLDDTTGQLQLDAAQALPATINGRELAIAVLTSLLDRVPEPARPAIAEAIAALSAQGGDDLAALLGVLGDGDLPAGVAAVVTQALAIASTAVDGALDTVREDVLPLLPEAAQEPVAQALQIVEQQLAMVRALIAGALATVPSGSPAPAPGSPAPAPGTPAPAGGPPLVGDLLDGLLSGLLGRRG